MSAFPFTPPPTPFLRLLRRSAVLQSPPNLALMSRRSPRSGGGGCNLATTPHLCFNTLRQKWLTDFQHATIHHHTRP